MKVAQAAVPPLVSGRLAGALGLAHPERAIGLLKRLRAGYLADAARYVDPRAVAVLAPMFEEAPEALLPAARELLRRKDYATAAGFLEFSTPALIEAFSLEIDDIDADLTHRISDLLFLEVSEDKLVEVLETAVGNGAAAELVRVAVRASESAQQRMRELTPRVARRTLAVLRKEAEAQGRPDLVP